MSKYPTFPDGKTQAYVGLSPDYFLTGGCVFSIATDAGWIHLTPPTTANFLCPNRQCTGGAVLYVEWSLDSNTSQPRTGTIVVSGAVHPLTILISQAGVSGSGSIEVTFDTPPANNAFSISTSPVMPTIRARAKVRGLSPDPTASTTFTWKVQLRTNKKTGNVKSCANGPEVPYDNRIQQDSTTVGNAPFTFALLNSGDIIGGKLKITASATVNGTPLSGDAPQASIQGTNADRAQVQGKIDSDVATPNFYGLAASDVSDALKRIGCQESAASPCQKVKDPNGQRQFDAAADGGIGNPIISGDNGIGMFQITNSTADDFTNDPAVVFDWSTNIARGVATFQKKAKVARGFPTGLSRQAAFKTLIDNINMTRHAGGLQPIPSYALPPFTRSGLIGSPPPSTPPNQLLEDAVRGYNGFNGYMYGLPLHEFTPDASYLLSVPDVKLKTLNTDASVWRRVRVTERPSGGDPNYVAHVTARSPTCGN